MSVCSYTPSDLSAMCLLKRIFAISQGPFTFPSLDGREANTSKQQDCYARFPIRRVRNCTPPALALLSYCANVMRCLSVSIPATSNTSLHLALCQ
ncbi:hypothetical protein IG631_20985 [Alternaria alternata]|nr:hypothetical protein IG631_20985 [Alternaria alternata]